MDDLKKEICMCGIVGIIGKEAVAPLLVKSLMRLEYRGYDSCGVAAISDQGIEVRKDVGGVTDVAEQQDLATTPGAIGIAHTRWATHGGVSRENAHPHLSCDGNFAIAHNGIISNYHALRADLQRRGHRFSSETDTEVFVHLLEETHLPGVSVEEAFIKALHRLDGTFAIVMISQHEPDKLFCAREKSPLLMGIAPEASFVGSDLNAILPFTRRAIILDDGEYAVLSRNGYRIRGIAGGEIRNKQVAELDWSVETAEKGGHQYYMEKEIWEQPEAIHRAMAIPQKEIVTLARWMHEARQNLLIGVGTTYYVALFGQYLLASLSGQFAPALSSDEVGGLALSNPETLLLGISQSGETFDTLQALRHAKEMGARTAAIVNVPGSSMTREVGLAVLQNSGPEICVISTKAAMAQMVILLRLAAELSRLKRYGSATQPLKIFKELNQLSELLTAVLQTQQERIRQLARRYHRHRNWFFLGRGIYTAIAYEAALKMKEVTYLHAEGMPAGFLKHGTLSLIDHETPSVFLLPPKEQSDLYDLTLSSMEEVHARGGKVIALGFDDVRGHVDEQVRLPKASPWIAPLLHLLAGQLLAYETAVALGRNVDRPRSLAKSVTVS
jgi:glucosamine--fructose-6-phosphate aminotransferase (isomerizing)